MDTHTHAECLTDNTLSIELDELSKLICNLSKGLCEESKVIRLLERVKQRIRSNTNGKIPNNISTQIIALENELASIRSRSKLPKFQLKTKIPAAANKGQSSSIVDDVKGKNFMVTTEDVIITSQINDRFSIHSGQATLAVVTLEDLINCDVEIVDIVSSVYIKKLNNCNIIVGPCTGSIMIHECRDCVFKLSCKQLRIHDSTNLRCFVNTNISPIIENCTGIGYGANKFIYEGYLDQIKTAGLEELMNSSKLEITDFCWQKNTPSPNWYLL